MKNYLKEIHIKFSQGDAREESYYNILEHMILKTAENLNKPKIHITILPKKTEGGNPDFRIWDGKSRIVGYIEAKNPEIDLDDVEHTEQIKRYKDIFPNFILTNFLEFCFYRNGKVIDRVSIGRQHTLVELETTPVSEHEKEFSELFEKFFSFTFPQNLNARLLSKELAKRTRFLRDQVIIEELKEQDKNGHNYILGFYDAFKRYLIFNLTEETFADLYSQTITYGLFAARTRCKEEFNRKNAVDFIPPTIGILQDVFQFISLGHAPKQMEWIIDDIAQVLASVDVSLILTEFFQYGKGDDPIVHFYETFLNEYNPKLREKRGVYYTPAPVVSFIVRSLNIILKEHFNKPDGLADLNVKILDPAAGTLTFMAEAANLALKEHIEKYGEGVKDDFIRKHLLKNFYAFELMMAPYAIGHMKMSYVFEEMGYTLRDQDSFKLYLTNTLEMEDIEQTDFPGMATLSEESYLAGKIKKETQILVILGNPPYSGHSSNVGEWISNEIKEYYKVDGKPLGERNPKWLQDDYVKFIRFAQWKIDQNGEGVLGFITNHSYIDNPTFRGMRQSLMKSFDEIFILDLHGNTLKKERCPDGSKDENVFDIRQGVAISLFIKKKEKKEECKIFHSDLWGLRDNKYEQLLENDFKTIKWQEINPKSEFYLFIPRDEKLEQAYLKYHKITDIFPVNGVGMTTARDKFVIDIEKNVLKRKIEMFLNEKISDELIAQTYNLKDKSNWKLKKVRQNLKNELVANGDSPKIKKSLTKILYRPFDTRWIFYHDELIERSRKEVMSHMFFENLGLCIGRAGQVVGLEKPWNIVFCSDCIEDLNLFYRGGNVNFPLYLYPNTGKKNLLDFAKKPKQKQPNINPKIFDMFVREGFKPSPTPEQIFYYIYAVLYSNIYREKYAEFLKIDFPRIPFTSNYDLFIELGKLGQELAEIHLMESTQLNKTLSRFEISGNNTVKKIEYIPVGAGLAPAQKKDSKENGKVYINKTQYFSNIDKKIWEYQIGGYQVMHKWLKDRKERVLTLEDIQLYIKIAKALQLTIEYQKRIDKLYPKVEKKLITI